jgi:hypothetical protein
MNVKTQYCETTVSSLFIFMFGTILIRIPVGYFQNLTELFQKSHSRMKSTNSYFKKEELTRELGLSIYEDYFKLLK